jgi:ABC-type sugar transport system substrate-binding protein
VSKFASLVGARSRLSAVLLVLTAIAVFALAGTVANAGQRSTKAGPLDGKKILVVPYWLDAFNTANTSWISRLLTAQGAAKVDVINPNKDPSKELNIIETAIASRNYDAILWQPISDEQAPSTIRKIQSAKIAQVVDFSSLNPGDNGLHFSAAYVDWAATYYQAGRAAGQFIKAHPKLGPPRIAYANIFPPEPKCDTVGQSLVRGVKSVMPNAKVVYNQGATSQQQAQSKMTDFITRQIKFNIYSGCGTAFDLGGYAALNAAGLAKANNKVPQSVYVSSLGGDPGELKLLFDRNSSMMRSVLFGPKSAAQAVVKLAVDQLTGKTPIDGDAKQAAALITLTPSCKASRAIVLDQFKGVAGFSIPPCK